MFPVENIPNESKLFRRIPPSQYKKKKITSAAFEDLETSVDWEKYSTPQETLDRLQPHIKREGWQVGCIIAWVPIQLGQQVQHDPKHDPKPYRAHSLIVGEKTLEISDALTEACKIVL